MRTWIPYDEVMEEYMKRPGFAEGVEQARRELDEEIAMYGTIGNPKPTPRTALTRTVVKRKPRTFSTKLKRATAAAL